MNAILTINTWGLGQCTVAGGDTTSEQTSLLKWCFLGNSNDRVLGYDGILRKGRTAHLRHLSVVAPSYDPDHGDSRNA